MKARELIERLEEFDPEQDVYFLSDKEAGVSVKDYLWIEDVYEDTDGDIILSNPGQ